MLIKLNSWSLALDNSLPKSTLIRSLLVALTSPQSWQLEIWECGLTTTLNTRRQSINHVKQLITISITSRHIRKYLSHETVETLIHAFITSRLDYCSSLLYNTPAIDLNKLQWDQNAAVKLVRNVPHWEHITPVLQSLYWLPVKHHINYKILLLTFKALNGLAPSYIQVLICIKEKSNYNLRSNTDSILLIPRKTLKTLGDILFCRAAPRYGTSF